MGRRVSSPDPAGQIAPRGPTADLLALVALERSSRRATESGSSALSRCTARRVLSGRTLRSTSVDRAGHRTRAAQNRAGSGPLASSGRSGDDGGPLRRGLDRR
jgi:hypothetical protein